MEQEISKEMHTCACLFIKSVEDEENATESYTPFQQSLSDHTWDQHPLNVREFGPYIDRRLAVVPSDLGMS